MLFNGSTEIPHLTVLGHGQNVKVKGSVLTILFQLKFMLFPGRYFWFRNRAGMV
jgi:hypothetical protein